MQNAESIDIGKNTKIIANDGGTILLAAKDFILDGEILAQNVSADAKIGSISIYIAENFELNGLINLALNQNYGNLYIACPSPLIQHTPQANVLNDNFISNELNLGNVHICGSENNSVKIAGDANIIWQSATTFTLESKKDILMESNAQVLSQGEGDFSAIEFVTTGTNGNFSGITIQKNALISSNQGTIYLQGSGGNLKAKNYGIYLAGAISSTGRGANAAKIKLDGSVAKAENNNFGIFLDQGQITSIDGNICLSGLNSSTKDLNHAVFLDNGALIATKTGSITIQGRAEAKTSSGVYIGNASIKSDFGGDIVIEGKGFGSGIFCSSDSLISSGRSLDLKGTDSIYGYGKISAKENVNIYIGLQGNGRLVLKNDIVASNVNIEGGDFNDTFLIDCKIKGQIKGNKGINTLIAKDDNNVFYIVSSNHGTLNDDIEFFDIQNLSGSLYHNDVYKFGPTGRIDGMIQGGNGTNTIQGPNIDSTWVLSDINVGEIKNVAKFKNIQNLIGGNSKNSFIFENNGYADGVIDGGNFGIIDCSKVLKDMSIDLHKISNVAQIYAPENFNNTLIGPEESSAWEINGPNQGKIGGINFYNFGVIIGGDQNNTFKFVGKGSLTGSLDGGWGANFLIGPDNFSVWTITGLNEGFIENIVKFKNIQNIIG
ncbi:MAG: hypothetical protein HZB76_05875, partial [Chlamydiae bacterium]|nr:hypothetical protein [Chlamydiota bacterium]